MSPQSLRIDPRLRTRKPIRLFAFQQKPYRPSVRDRLGFLPYRVMDESQNDVCEESVHEVRSGELRQRVGYAALYPYGVRVSVDEFREVGR